MRPSVGKPVLGLKLSFTRISFSFFLTPAYHIEPPSPKNSPYYCYYYLCWRFSRSMLTPHLTWNMFSSRWGDRSTFLLGTNLENERWDDAYGKGTYGRITFPCHGCWPPPSCGGPYLCCCFVGKRRAERKRGRGKQKKLEKVWVEWFSSRLSGSNINN